MGGDGPAPVEVFVSLAGSSFSLAAHPSAPPMRAHFRQSAAPPAFNFGHRILKELFRLVHGGLGGANRGYLNRLAMDLRDGQSRFVPHLR